MRRNRRRGAFSKEKIVMAASTVLALGTLTVTGLWLGAGNKSQDDGYVVDLSTIEQDMTTGLSEKEDIQFADHVTQDATTQNAPTDDLDYDPYFQETNSGNVENPDISGSQSMSDGVKEEAKQEADTENREEKKENAAETGNVEGGDQEALSTAMQPALNFTDEDTLVWPISGNILVNFSMDQTIYFPTLDQYKYNPAIVIEAHEGDLITAAAAGKVTGVYEDREIGKAVTMDLGNGYEVTYGQLDNILVSEGSYVAKGDVIAQVASPTKYYSVEGTNVYFKLTKDGVPVNPMSKLK